MPTDAVGPTKTDTAATPRERQTRQEKIGQAAALTPGQMNAVRAAFKGDETTLHDEVIPKLRQEIRALSEKIG